MNEAKKELTNNTLLDIFQHLLACFCHNNKGLISYPSFWPCTSEKDSGILCFMHYGCFGKHSFSWNCNGTDNASNNIKSNHELCGLKVTIKED